MQARDISNVSYIYTTSHYETYATYLHYNVWIKLCTYNLAALAISCGIHVLLFSVVYSVWEDQRVLPWYITTSDVIIP